MALLAQGFDPSGYTPDYSVANRANEQMFQNQQQGIGTLVKGINDAQKEQKDLAQKDKEMAAKIKGTMSLLDNAKALYPDFAAQIDSTKLQLSDPSLSNLDKIGIAGQVENSLNMMTAKGTEATKTALQIAEMQQRERLATIGGSTKRDTTIKTVYDSSVGSNRDAIIDSQTGEIVGFVGEGPINAPMPTDLPATIPSGSQDLGNPPMQYPTVEGPSINPDQAKSLGYDSYGRQRVLSDGNIYHLNLDSSVLPDTRPIEPLSKSAQEELIKRSASTPVGLIPNQATAIDNSLAMTPSTTAPTNATAIASAANQGQPKPRFGPPKEDPAKIAERERRARLDESTIAANIAAANKAASETQAKEEKIVASQQATQAAAQNARSTIRDQIAQVNKYADRIGSTFISDLAKKGSQYLSTSDQARLSKAMEPISSAMIWDQMSKLRAASATGSTGLGSLTEGERRNLESTVISLDSMQDPRDIKRAMTKIEDYMRNAEYGNWYERKALVDEGKLSPIRFNEIEKGYSNPNLIPTTGALRTTPDQEALLKQFENQ